MKSNHNDSKLKLTDNSKLKEIGSAKLTPQPAIAEPIYIGVNMPLEQANEYIAKVRWIFDESCRRWGGIVPNKKHRLVFLRIV